MLTSDKRIDDIVKMLDDFMSNKGGHMNIKVNNNGGIKYKDKQKSVKTSRSLDCIEGNTACSSPTLFEGLDDDGNESLQ